MTFKTGVEEFWNWFASEAKRFHAAIETKRCSDLQLEVSPAVERWLAGMAWVFGPGEKEGEHSFTLSPEGIVHKQFLTDYWLSRAPKMPGWRFYSSRQPSKEAKWEIHIADEVFAGKEMWVTPVPMRDEERFDITVWHPRFARLNEQTQFTVTFLWLDEMLGEHRTMNWIGEIKISDQQLREAMPFSELDQFIRQTTSERDWKKLPPGQCYSLYELQESPGDFLRADVRVGNSCNMKLINAYLGAQGGMDDLLAGTGADFVFVAFNSDILPQGKEADMRGEIEESLESELASAHSGRILGGAWGVRQSYIDAVIFDGDRSIELMRRVLVRRKLTPGTAIHYFAASKRNKSVKQ